MDLRLGKPSNSDENFFGDFLKGFEPRFEYNKDDFQVSVMFRSQTTNKQQS